MYDRGVGKKIKSIRIHIVILTLFGTVSILILKKTLNKKILDKKIFLFPRSWQWVFAFWAAVGITQ